MVSLSIRQRLVALSLLALAALVCIGIFAAWQASRLNQRLDETILKHQQMIVAVELARGAQVNFKTQVQEWKNILLRGRNPADFDKHLNGFNKEAKAVEAKLTELKTVAGQLDIAERLKVEDVLAEFGKLPPAYLAALEAYDRNASDPASTVDKLVKGMDRGPTAKIDGLAKEIREVTEELGKQELSAAQAINQAVRLGLMVFIGLTTLALAFIAWLIIGSVTRPLGTLERTMQQISSTSDLTHRVDISHNDEIGRMAKAFNQMIEKIHGAIGKVHGAAKQVSSLAGEVNSAAVTVAESSTQQSDATSASSAAIEQLTVSINLVAENAEMVHRESVAAESTASEGAAVAQKVSDKIREIAASLDAATQVMSSLSQRAEEIGGVVSVIKDIADQTNLLALNAAIEAARAGETGRGFAVVADEVRKLAERTTQATSEITATIANVQHDTKAADTGLSQARGRVEEGVSGTLDIVTVLDKLSQAAREMVMRTAEINDALKEQSTASTDIAQNVERITQQANENSSISQTARSSASSLSDLATDLGSLVGQFRTAAA
jgi:methyl-accepting chemotaxis protein